MRKPLPPILFAYIAGIIGGSYFPIPLSFLLAGIIAGSGALVVCFFGSRGRVAMVLSLGIFALFGFLFIGRILHPELPSHHLVRFAGDEKLRVEGVLVRPPEFTEDRVRLYVRGERVYLGEGSTPATGNLLLTVKDRQCDLRYGDRVRFVSKLYLPRPASNPGGFDYRRFLALQGVRVTAYANSSAEVVRMEEGKGNAFLHLVERGREKIRVFLDENAPAESKGIIKALVLGERGDISKAVSEKFIVSGVTHILSISGLHVALVAAFFFGATRLILRFFPFLLLRVNVNKASAVVAILPVIFYTFIAGLGVAAVRSTIMVLSFLLALLLDREKDLYDALFAAAFFILVVNPAALYDISFQLSFLSVLGLLYLIPRFLEFFSFLKDWPFSSWVEEQPRWKRKALAFLGGSLLTSAAAILATGPLVTYYFNRVSLVGFLSNLLLVPLMGFGNTLLSLLTALFVFISFPLARILTTVNVFLLDVSLVLVDFFSRFPGASHRVSTPTYPEMLLIYGMLILAANVKRWSRALPGLMLLCGIYLVIQVYDYQSTYHGKELTVTFLDVGQADAAVVCFPGGKVMVIDGGGSPDGSFDTGERIVAPFLWKLKRKSIDYLVNSHPHPDHLQGLIFLLENFRVGNIWGNGDTEISSLWASKFSETAGDRLRAKGWWERGEEVNGVKIVSLHPPLEEKRRMKFSGNDASLALRLDYGDVSFLFCGDVEAAAEQEILETGAGIQSTVMKVPHHGSKSSSTQPFLESVRPSYAVFTVRPGTRSYLPHPVVLDRYERLGVKIYRSDRHGAITFTTDGKNLKVQTFAGKN